MLYIFELNSPSYCKPVCFTLAMHTCTFLCVSAVILDYLKNYCADKVTCTFLFKVHGNWWHNAPPPFFPSFFCVDTATSYVHSRCIKTRLQSNNENPAFKSRNFLSSGKTVAWTKSWSLFFVPFQLIHNIHAGSLLHTAVTQKHTVRVSEFRTSVTIMYVPFWTCMHCSMQGSTGIMRF